MPLSVAAEDVAAALRRLAARKPRAAKEAEMVLQEFASADWDEQELPPPLELDRLRVGQWLWLTVPRAFVASAEAKLEVIHALEHFFDELGPAGDPYAALCRRPETRALVTAEPGDRQLGRLYKDAIAATGCEPPNVDGFVWGELMSDAEVNAYDAAAGALCRAVDLGLLVPGARGAEEVRRTVTSKAIASRIPTILAERWDSWLRRLTRLAPQLAEHVLQLLDRAEPCSAEAEDHATGPLRAFLAAVVDPVGLTGAGYLPPATIRPLIDAFPDLIYDLDARNPRNQRDVPWLLMADDQLRSAKLVRQRSGRLAATPRGRRLANDPAALLELAASLIFPDDPFGEVVALAVCVAADRGRAGRLDALDEAFEHVSQGGWTAADGSTPTPIDVTSPGIRALHQLELLRIVPRAYRRGRPAAIDAGSRAVLAQAIRRRGERAVDDMEWL